MDQQVDGTQVGEDDVFIRLRAAIHNKTLSAANHPDNETLAAYAEEKLSSERVAHVDRHLMLCADNSCHRFLGNHLRARRHSASWARRWLQGLRVPLHRPILTVPALCAAAFALTMLLRGTQLQSSLPGYIAQVQGQEQSWLDADGRHGQESLVFSADSIIEVTLRPQHQVRGAVEMRMFLVKTDDIDVMVSAESKLAREMDGIYDIDISNSQERGASGALHLQRRVGELLGRRSGRFHLLVGVGRPGTLPRRQQLRDLALNVGQFGVGTEDGGWQWFRWIVKLRNDRNGL